MTQAQSPALKNGGPSIHLITDVKTSYSRYVALNYTNRKLSNVSIQVSYKK